MLKIQGSKKWKEMMSQSREGPYKIVVFDRYVVGCCSTEQTTTTEPKFIFCFLASKKADIFVMVSLSIIFFDFSLVHMVKNYSRTASKRDGWVRVRGGWVALMSEWEKNQITWRIFCWADFSYKARSWATSFDWMFLGNIQFLVSFSSQEKRKIIDT